MGITNHGLEMMGFKLLPDGETISGVFGKLYVFMAEGLHLEDTALPPGKGTINGQDYLIGFGTGLNAICRSLVSDDFIEDEDKWIQNKKASGPFAIVYIGPTGTHVNTSPYFMEENGMLTTHDSFKNARLEIKAMEQKVIPPLLAALEASFSAGEHPVRFRPLEEAFFGTSPTGKTIHDYIISVNATAYVARKLSQQEFKMTLNIALCLASDLNPRVASFMHLGFQEQDRLKKFLNLFLSIEIETHATFKKIDHSSFLNSLIQAPSPSIKETVDLLFSTQHKKLTTLKDHFIWCVICKWKHLTDADVTQFERLKKIRDDIAHGNISSLPPGVEREAERFIIKIQAGQK